MTKFLKSPETKLFAAMFCSDGETVEGMWSICQPRQWPNHAFSLKTLSVKHGFSQKLNAEVSTGSLLFSNELSESIDLPICQTSSHQTRTGAAQVWSFQKSDAMKPPQEGWQVPFDGPARGAQMDRDAKRGLDHA